MARKRLPPGDRASRMPVVPPRVKRVRRFRRVQRHRVGAVDDDADVVAARRCARRRPSSCRRSNYHRPRSPTTSCTAVRRRARVGRRAPRDTADDRCREEQGEGGAPALVHREDLLVEVRASCAMSVERSGPFASSICTLGSARRLAFATHCSLAAVPAIRQSSYAAAAHSAAADFLAEIFCAEELKRLFALPTASLCGAGQAACSRVDPYRCTARRRPERADRGRAGEAADAAPSR
jgi:hypothetical protein